MLSYIYIRLKINIIIERVLEIKNKKILYSVLNWGLGHATRSVSIINELLQNGCEVTLAGNGESGKYLKNSFKDLQYFETPDLVINYSSIGWLQPVKIASQIPKITNSIINDLHWVNEFAKSNKIDLIISDNRYGFRNKKIRSICITHQINPPFPILKNQLLRKIHNWLDQFSEIWVPDYSNHKLTGKLSVPPKKLQSKTIFINPQTQLKKYDHNNDFEGYILLLGGPEPQRSLLHKNILGAKKYSDKPIKVFGNSQRISKNKLHQEFGIVSGEELSKNLNSNSQVIARSGYSTIMDMNHIGCNVEYIPTPGQAEQIYLANLLNQH